MEALAAKQSKDTARTFEEAGAHLLNKEEKSLAHVGRPRPRRGHNQARLLLILLLCAHTHHHSLYLSIQNTLYTRGSMPVYGSIA